MRGGLCDGSKQGERCARSLGANTFADLRIGLGSVGVPPRPAARRAASTRATAPPRSCASCAVPACSRRNAAAQWMVCGLRGLLVPVRRLLFAVIAPGGRLLSLVAGDWSRAVGPKPRRRGSRAASAATLWSTSLRVSGVSQAWPWAIRHARRRGRTAGRLAVRAALAGRSRRAGREPRHFRVEAAPALVTDVSLAFCFVSTFGDSSR